MPYFSSTPGPLRVAEPLAGGNGVRVLSDSFFSRVIATDSPRAIVRCVKLRQPVAQTAPSTATTERDPETAFQPSNVREIQSIAVSHHPCIVRPRDVWLASPGRQPAFLSVATELCYSFDRTDIDLAAFVQMRIRNEQATRLLPDPREREHLAYQLMSAVAHIHAHGMVYGDFCLSNLRVSFSRSNPPHPVLRIGNFSQCWYVGGACDTAAVPDESPIPAEFGWADDGRRSQKSDIRSCGSVVYFIFTGSPFDMRSTEPHAVLSRQFGTDEPLTNVLLSMLSHDPAARPAASAVLDAPFFASIAPGAVQNVPDLGLRCTRVVDALKNMQVPTEPYREIPDGRQWGVGMLSNIAAVLRGVQLPEQRSSWTIQRMSRTAFTAVELWLRSFDTKIRSPVGGLTDMDEERRTFACCALASKLVHGNASPANRMVALSALSSWTHTGGRRGAFISSALTEATLAVDEHAVFSRLGGRLVVPTPIDFLHCYAGANHSSVQAREYAEVLIESIVITPRVYASCGARLAALWCLAIAEGPAVPVYDEHGAVVNIGSIPESFMRVAGEVTTERLRYMADPVAEYITERFAAATSPLAAFRKAVPTQVPQEDWFAHVTGMPESEYAQPGRRRFVVRGDDPAWGPTLAIRNARTFTTYQCGSFTVPRIRDLAGHAASIPEARRTDRRACVFRVLYRAANETPSRFVDVARLQARPENRGAVFQLASNLNGVEAPSEDARLDSGRFGTDYVHDHTQGPAASISVAAAGIARLYAGMLADNPGLATANDQDGWVQTSTRQIEFLRDHQASGLLGVVNGYVVLDSKKHVPMPADENQRRAFIGDARVGLHCDCEVVFSGTTDDKRHFSLATTRQVVDQVCVAALNIGQGKTGYDNSIIDADRAKTAHLLQVAYLGTYYAAAARGKKKLVLTLIGGGAFGNPLSMIASAILAAHTEVTGGLGSTLQEVVLPLYAPGVPQEIADLVNKLKEAGLPARIGRINGDGSITDE
jgi:hypothetical protein